MSQLSANERQELISWEARWYKLPVHETVDYQFRRALEGKENTLIVGPRGVGKTSTVERVIKQIESEELSRIMQKDADPPFAKGILSYTTADASGRKTVFTDLLRELHCQSAGGLIRSWSPSDFVDRVLEELRRGGIRVVCIDEAHKINAHNLDHLCDVYNAAVMSRYPLGLVLVGEYALRDNLRDTRHLGQRFAGEVRFERSKVATRDLERWHPHLKRLKEQLQEREWKQLTKKVNTQANGSFRRLRAILSNANDLAERMNQPIHEEILDLVFEKLASEE